MHHVSIRFAAFALTGLALVLPRSAEAQFGSCDRDGDGARSLLCGGADCDDNDARRYPGAVEVCDALGVDEDCDLSTGGFRDADGDGFNSSACFNRDRNGNPVAQGNDCNDSNPAVHIIAAEQCNGQDDNCDGNVDEGIEVWLYIDADGDGYGTGAPLLMCPTSAGYASRDGDCDDTNPAIVPGALICQGRDTLQCGPQGVYVPTTCQRRASCHAQPNGTGVCECRRGIRRNGTCR